MLIEEITRIKPYTVQDKQDHSDPDIPQGVGPHEKREQELMARGEKPMAFFYDFNMDKWAKLAEQGKVKIFSGFQKDHFIATLPGEEWRAQRAKKLKKAFSQKQITPDKFHYLIGRLLGYSKDEFHAFRQHVKSIGMW